MIKTLTPYYLTTPFVSPATGLTCTSYTINIFVWNGAIGNLPASPYYRMTKQNPTGSTSDSVVNIARIINDFIDFRPRKGTDTSFVNANNQAWVRHYVTYETTDPQDAITPQLLTTELIVKGYGYGLSGENPDTPDNLIMLDGSEYKVNRTGFFSLSIEQPVPDLSTSTINAVDDAIAIFYQNTCLNVLTNDNLGTEPTSIIGIDASSFATDYGTLTINRSCIDFVAGSTFTATPQTFTYTIEDAYGFIDTATVTLTASELPTAITAVDDIFFLNSTDTVVLDVLANDSLGTEPTTITSVVQTGLTSGTITITGAGTTLTFTPNGTIPASDETFTYTITDDIAATDTANVTLQIGAVGEFLWYAETPPIAPYIVLTGTYADTLGSFSFEIVEGTRTYINRCVITSSLAYTGETAPILTYDETITCT